MRYTVNKKNYPINKIIYNLVDEIWSIDLVDMIDNKVSKNKRSRYIIIIIGKFNKYTSCIFLKIKNAQTETDEISSVLTNTKRKAIKKSDFIVLFFKTSKK